jgi:hypothetical protein
MTSQIDVHQWIEKILKEFQSIKSFKSVEVYSFYDKTEPWGVQLKLNGIYLESIRCQPEDKNPGEKLYITISDATANPHSNNDFREWAREHTLRFAKEIGIIGGFIEIVPLEEISIDKKSWRCNILFRGVRIGKIEHN